MDLNEAKMQKRRTISLIIIGLLALFFLIGIAVYYAYVNDSFKKTARMEIFANNTYTETLHVVTDKDYEPFSYIDRKNEYAGLDVELIAEIANRLEMNLDLQLLDWSTAQEKLLNGEADLILNMEVSKVEESDELIGTIPTAEKQYVVYGYNSVNYLGQLYGKKIGSMQLFPELGLDITYIETYTEMFNKLEARELDYVICPIQVANSFLNKIDSKGIIQSYPISYMYGCIAFKSSDTELRDKVNDIVVELQSSGFIEGLDEKWILKRYEDVSFTTFIGNAPVVIAIFFVVVVVVFILIIYITVISNRNKIGKVYLSKIEEQNKELASANAAKSTFLFNMSHDIRTPMNAIIGFNTLAKKNIDNKEALKEYLSKIEISSNHLLGLINDALEMSKIESDKIELELKPMDIHEAMLTLDTIVHDLATKKNQEFVCEVINISHPYIVADHLRLDRIFLNLLSNAIKFTPENGHVKLTINEKSADDNKVSYEFMVIDDGIGMSEEFLKKIYLPFEREKTSTVSRVEGTGLGMAITKRLVDLMNGEINVKSKLGEGTTFIINLTFDIAKDYEKKEEIIEEKKESLSITNNKILVVDDNEINREILKALLEDLGYETIEASDGDEAVEIVKNAKLGDFSLILMDIQMPKMNGYEATKAIRSLDSEMKDIPIVALTANAFKEDRDNAMNSGMNEHLAKPIELDKLVSVLERFIKQ